MRQLRFRMLRTRRLRHRLCVLMVIFTCSQLLLWVYRRNSPAQDQVPIDKFLTISLSAPPNVTVVTAFFDLGKFQKGDDSSLFFDPGLYRKWAGTYRYMQNPLVVFTDSTAFRELFLEMRKDKLDITRVDLVSRSSIWAFDYLDKVKRSQAWAGLKSRAGDCVSWQTLQNSCAEGSVVSEKAPKAGCTSS